MAMNDDACYVAYLLCMHVLHKKNVKLTVTYYSITSSRHAFPYQHYFCENVYSFTLS